eukprot:GFYU01003449.1.p1 GENE.GFYU01003449.1~~GFYU01003449.1.p1  ORF type:complete len:443 (-),score=116.68 GFYU01003449.1:47-1276(-)
MCQGCTPEVRTAGHQVTEVKKLCPNGMTQAQIDIIKATAPVVGENALKITKTFYPIMFKNNPEVLQFFNPANQRTGRQPEALANAVVAYATNIDNLGVLGAAVEIMAVKHVALGIKAEHYGIVGSNLMKAIHEVLGDAVTEEVHDAWAAAYGQLADILIDAEAKMYDDLANREGGWNGWRPFTVIRKDVEAGNIVTFELEPVDKKPVSAIIPGEYITLMFPNGLPGHDGLIAPRHYSVSSKVGANYTISIRRHDQGLFSRHLVDNVKVGDQLNIAPPIGRFRLSEKGDASRRAVFIGGGVGYTPLVSLSGEATKKGHPCTFFYSAKTAEEVKNVCAKFSDLDIRKETTAVTGTGTRLSGQSIVDVVGKDADFYICGPADMITGISAQLKEVGVAAADIHYEFFGPLRKV